MRQVSRAFVRRCREGVGKRMNIEPSQSRRRQERIDRELRENIDSVIALQNCFARLYREDQIR